MRLLWFGHRDIKHRNAGGAERTIYEVGRRLAAKGHEFHLVSVNPSDLPAEETIDRIVVHRKRGNLRVHLEVPSIIRKIKPDVIVDDLAHVIPWGSPIFTNESVIAFFHHLHARSLHGQVSFPTAELLTWLETRYSSIYSDSVFVTETSTGVNDLVNLGVSAGQVRIIPPGVDSELFRPNRKTETPSLVYFGGLRDYKRPWLAIEVMYQISQIQDVSLTVIGEGKSLERVRKLAIDYDLCKNITFTGRIRQEELARKVSESWVNLHFSVTEGFGFSILEAAAAGTPTVALDAFGISDVVSQFGFGMIVRDLKQFPNALCDIFEHNDKWSRMVHESASIFSWDRCAEMWENLALHPCKI